MMLIPKPELSQVIFYFTTADQGLYLKTPEGNLITNLQNQTV